MSSGQWYPKSSIVGVRSYSIFCCKPCQKSFPQLSLPEYTQTTKWTTSACSTFKFLSKKSFGKNALKSHKEHRMHTFKFRRWQIFLYYNCLSNFTTTAIGKLYWKKILRSGVMGQVGKFSESWSFFSRWNIPSPKILFETIASLSLSNLM